MIVRKLYRKTYVKVGRTSYSALNRMNCVKKGRVLLIVPMAIALPKVQKKGRTCLMAPRTNTPLLIPPVVVFEAAVT